MTSLKLRRIAALVAIAGGLVAIGSGLYAHSSQPMFGYPWEFVSWFKDTAVLSGVGLIIGGGILMVIGGLITFVSEVWGGIITVLALIPALVFTFESVWNAWTIMGYLWVPFALAWFSAILCGYAVYKDVPSYDVPATDDQPARVV